MEDKKLLREELLKHVKALYECHQTSDKLKNELESAFPEIKESREDRIKKNLIEFLDSVWYLGKDANFDKWGKADCSDWIAWIEKQREPLDNIVKRATTEKQRILITETNGVANIDWDTRSLQDVKLLLEYGLDYIKKLEKQGKQKFNYTTLVETGNGGINALITRELPTNNDCNEQNHFFDFKAKDWYVSEVDGKIHNMTYNPTDKVEPKFHKGDWIVFNGLTLYVKEVVKGFYRTISKDGIPNSYDWDIDNVARLWTIQDAKDGDILVANKKGQPFIFNGHYDEDTDYIYAYCGISDLVKNDSFYYDGEGVEEEFKVWCINENVFPATKEQRELFFQEMKEAGYTFDFEKKELKKINSYCKEHCKGFQETGKCFADGDCKDKRETEQSSLGFFN